MIKQRQILKQKVVVHRSEEQLKLAAKKAMLRRQGKIHIDINASKLAKVAAKHMSKSDRTKRALKAAKTRKSRQHLINQKIAKTHKMNNR